MFYTDQELTTEQQYNSFKLDFSNKPRIFDPIPTKKTKPVNSIDSVEKERDSVMHKMYVSNVGNRLREMDVPMDVDCQRWAWELMQNAKDSIAIPDSIIKKDKVDIQLFLKDDEVIFMHNGLPFNGKAYLALLYKYSDGKSNNAESTGRFGTGFLTTHSLSKIVNVEGDIFIIHEDLTNFKGTIFDLKENIAGFEVTMYRDGSTPDELISGIQRMEKEKKFYIGEPSGWTTYKYILKTKRNHESSELGFQNFKDNIAQTMLFNSKFGIVQLTYKNLFTTTIQRINTEVVNDVSIVTFQLQNESITNRKFIIKTIIEHSDELSIRFGQERNLRLSCCIELTENNELFYDTKSPCLFCSLPLVGSESHEMPITLNSDDFEPNTERQGILLDGSDKKQDKDCLSDVGINRLILKRSIPLFESIVKHCSEKQYKSLHILTRGLKEIPKVARDFDPNWYKKNVMIPYRSVLLKYSIVYTDVGIKKIDEVFIPIYPFGKSIEYKKEYHFFTQTFFGIVPRFEESIEWSNRIWNELPNLVNVTRLLNAFREKERSNEIKNSFIKFVWNNHRDLLYKIPVLFNQNNEFVEYTDEFADGLNVQEDAVDLMEELNIQWKKNHLNKCITSINLPVIHDHKYAMSTIKQIKSPMKNYIITRYVIKNNEKREKMFMFSKEFFPKKFQQYGKPVESYKAESLDSDLWDASDQQLFEDMMSIIEEKRNINKVTIPNLVEFIDFVRKYYQDPNVFDERCLIPAKSGNLHKLKQLFEEKNIPKLLINDANKYLNYDINDEMKDPTFSCITAPKEFNLINLMTIVNKKLSSNSLITDEKKLQMSLTILSFLPEEEGDLKNYQSHLQEAAKKLDFQVSSNENISNQTKFFWEQANLVIIQTIEYAISKCNNSQTFKSRFNIQIDEYLNNFVDLLHPDKIKLIPNQEGIFCLRTEISNDINIPDSIKQVFKVLNEDLKPKLKMKTVDIKCNKNESIDTIIGKMNEFLKNAEKEKQQIAASMIIDLLPSDQAIICQQKNIQTLYHNLTNNPSNISQINCSNEAFWIPANKIIINYYQHLIEKSQCMKNLELKTRITDFQYIELLNAFHSYLQIDEIALIPNYYGHFKKKNELYVLHLPAEIFKAIKKYLKIDLFVNFIDQRVKIEVNEYSIFNTAKIINNNFFQANEKSQFLLSKQIIRFIPKRGELSEKLRNLLNIANAFDDTNLNPFEVEQCDNLYSYAQAIVIKYINQKIEKCKSLDGLKTYFPDPILFLNTNKQILDTKYKIVPDQTGNFHKIDELYQDCGIYDELKQILFHKINLYEKLIHKEITAFHSDKTWNNDSTLEYINIYASDIAHEMIYIFPEDENEKQQQLFNLYTSFNEKSKEPIMLKLPTHFWEKTNGFIIDGIVKCIESKKNLLEISEKEDKAIEILKTLYEFRSPMNSKYQKINMIPNQLGELKCYNDLYKEECCIPDDFKDVLTNYFSFDIRSMLQDSRLSIKVEKSLSVDSSKVSKVIKEGFMINIPEKTLIERSEKFIIFQPLEENAKIQKFVNCYKGICKMSFDPISISTSNSHLWDVPIKVLTKIMTDTLIADETIQNCCRRISKNENEVFHLLNEFYYFEKEAPIYPNMLGKFCYQSKVFTPIEIDDMILDIYALLNPKDDFRKQLIHPKINATFSKKRLNEIAVKIDEEIKKIMNDKHRKNDEKVIQGCKLLIYQWMKENSSKNDLLPYVIKEKMNIIVDIIIDENKRSALKDILDKSPERFPELIFDAILLEQKQKEEKERKRKEDEENERIRRQNLERRQRLLEMERQRRLQRQRQREENERQRQREENERQRQREENERQRQREENERQRQREENERQRQREENERQRQREENERQRQREENERQRQREENERQRQLQRQREENERQRQPNFNVHNFAVGQFTQPITVIPYRKKVMNQVESSLRRIFTNVNSDEQNKNAYYCSFVNENEDYLDDFHVVTLFSDSNKNIQLNNIEVELASEFLSLFVIIVAPIESEYHESNFINEIKIIANIGYDLEGYDIVKHFGSLISINDDDFSLKLNDNYHLLIKEKYINNHCISFNDWESELKELMHQI